MRRHATLLAGAAMLMLGMPAAAQTPVVLNFNTGTTACTNVDGGATNQACTTDGQFIGANYGSTAQLTVSYDPSEPANSADRLSLQFAHDGYFQPATGLAYAFPAGPANEPSKIVFTPVAGYEVSFGSFGWDKVSATSSANFFFQVRSPTNALLFSAGNSAINYTVNTGYYAGPLTFLFGNGAMGLVGIDNIALNVRAAVLPPTPGAVPEPASWALMIAGFGLAGCAMRRRRVGAHAFA